MTLSRWRRANARRRSPRRGRETSVLAADVERPVDHQRDERGEASGTRQRSSPVAASSAEREPSWRRPGSLSPRRPAAGDVRWPRRWGRASVPGRSARRRRRGGCRRCRRRARRRRAPWRGGSSPRFPAAGSTGVPVGPGPGSSPVRAGLPRKHPHIRAARSAGRRQRDRAARVRRSSAAVASCPRPPGPDRGGPRRRGRGGRAPIGGASGWATAGQVPSVGCTGGVMAFARAPPVDGSGEEGRPPARGTDAPGPSMRSSAAQTPTRTGFGRGRSWGDRRPGRGPDRFPGRRVAVAQAAQARRCACTRARSGGSRLPLT